ncbi:MAG: SDR family NAD(P)-dependent oxidoreductase, partial [Cytophagaceae bacterium]
MQIDLTGRVAVVTGATGQLGRTMARSLAECGADVAVHYHSNQAKADEIIRDIQAMGRRAIAVAADITQELPVYAMRDRVYAELGTADIIVNNAVSQYGWTSVLEQKIEDYDGQYETCVRHNVLMAKAFVPAMQEKKYGRVIGINTECAMQAA